MLKYRHCITDQFLVEAIKSFTSNSEKALIVYQHYMIYVYAKTILKVPTLVQTVTIVSKCGIEHKYVHFDLKIISLRILDL